MKGFTTEANHREDGEDAECDDLLNDLQLNERERSTVTFKAKAIGRNLKTVFKERQTPGDEDDSDDGCGVAQEAHVLEL